MGGGSFDECRIPIGSPPANFFVSKAIVLKIGNRFKGYMKLIVWAGISHSSLWSLREVCLKSHRDWKWVSKSMQISLKILYLTIRFFLTIINNNFGGLGSLLFEYHYNIRWVDSMGVACDDFQVDSGLPLGFPYFQRHFPSTAVSQIAVKNPTRSRSEKMCQEIR